MATTLYVALERLIDMSEPSDWKLDETLARSMMTHDCRLVAAFAPHRFGLIFETREEVEEAWSYIRSWLSRKGLHFESRCVLLKADGDTTELRSESGWWLANSADAQAWAPNLRIIDNLPAARASLSQRIKNLLAAALF